MAHITEELKAKIIAEMERQSVAPPPPPIDADKSISLSDSGYDELAALIGSLNVDIKTPKIASVPIFKPCIRLYSNLFLSLYLSPACETCADHWW